MKHGLAEYTRQQKVGSKLRLRYAIPYRAAIKAELIWRRSWETRQKGEMVIFEYINGSYNPRRRHSALGWKSPVSFKRKVA